MKLRLIRNIALFLALFSVVGGVGYKLGQRDRLTNSGSQLDLSMMWKVKDKLTSLYLDKSKINNSQMEYGAIKGMVSSLGDPYTVYLSPTENKSTNQDLEGQFGGVGISLGYSKDNVLAVMTPLVKTPAEKAGIKAGDLILRIIDKSNNIDKDTTGITLEEAVNLIRGKVGTEVTLKMYREGRADSYDVTLKRDNIVVPSIELEWREVDGKKVAWVKLYKFTETLYKDWGDVVNKIKSGKGDNYGGIVLDLRNNPGGYLEAAVTVASDFIDKGVVVTQESTNAVKQSYEVDSGRRQLLSDPLVVLVNGGSASAAEILAGALKDHNRAKLVGVKTFGKGTVQQPVDFADGSGLHVTIAKWLLPDGSNIHGVGINPDVEVKESTDLSSKDDLQLNKAIEVLLQK